MTCLHRFVGLAVALAAFWLAACSSDVEVEGRLQRFVARYPDQSSRTIFQLEQTDGARLELRFDDEAADLDTGAHLFVTGRWEAGSLRVESARVLAPPQAALADPQNPPAPRKMAMMLFNFADDKREPITVDQVREHVFVRPTSTVAFMKEQSFGRLVLEGKNRVDGDVFGWYTLPHESTICDPGLWASAAVAAAQTAGHDMIGYDHLVFMFPEVGSCKWTGFGQIPGSFTWINGAATAGRGLAVISHEMGHNFRLEHAGSYSCMGPVRRVTLGNNCVSSEYGNPLDVMGSAFAWHTNVYNKLAAGWLDESNIKRVTESGTYTLLPLERPSSGIQGLVVAKDARFFYYLEARETFGFDNFPVTDPAVNGVVVLLGPSYRERRTSLLLDMVPETATFDDAPLPVGRSFNDPDGKVRITLLERTDAGAVVKIEIPGIPPDAGADAAVGAEKGDGGDAVQAAAPDAPPPDAEAMPSDAALASSDAAETPSTPPADGGCSCAVARGAGKALRASSSLVGFLAMTLIVGRRAFRQRRVRSRASASSSNQTSLSASP